ncbi:endolytic transglycosylase MltG [Tumidithrix elongata RA019]|uniref:Endolytic murein transglycosylase n=1 Tax=Tumidithrix elongata BACA0141 TaxID=2716417 RepID=A0AAW9PZD1_9CYAN|nr:endolytic transglycosylase MltG [Tumidithrix elongata RA019]
MQKTQKKKPSWWFYGVFLPLTLLLSGWGSSLWWLWASGAPSNTVSTSVRIKIPDGMPSQVIGRELEAAGVIRSSLALRLWLQWLAWEEGDTRPLRAGIYDFSTTQPLREVVAQLQTAKPVEVRFTIPEGWTIAQMAAYFEEKGFFPAAEFITAANKVQPKRRSWLPDSIPSLEGYLFPDTYQIPPNEVSPERLIELMLDRFEQTALPVYKARQSGQSKIAISLADWVTLASIVEKEAVLEKERRTIAGVFWQRLKRNMPLEADPTVEYGLKIKQTPDKPLTLDQVRTPSPYNTYMNEGLPPGAIASPSLASLKATLNPEATEYLFFVARYDGSHIFSRTLEEHKQAVQQVDKQFRSKTESN